jgi:hypothetical protein
VTGRTSSPDGPMGGLVWGGDLWTDVAFLTMIAGTVTGAAGMIVWVAGSTLLLLAGHGPGPGPLEAARAVAGGGGLHAVWPGVQLPAVALLTTLLATLLATLLGGGVAVGVRWWRGAHPPRDGFATRAQFAALLPGRAAIRRAGQLRPSLRSVTRLRPADLGVPLGRLGGWVADGGGRCCAPHGRTSS